MSCAFCIQIPLFPSPCHFVNHTNARACCVTNPACHFMFDTRCFRNGMCSSGACCPLRFIHIILYPAVSQTTPVPVHTASLIPPATEHSTPTISRTVCVVQVLTVPHVSYTYPPTSCPLPFHKPNAHASGLYAQSTEYHTRNTWVFGLCPF